MMKSLLTVASLLGGAWLLVAQQPAPKPDLAAPTTRPSESKPSAAPVTGTIQDKQDKPTSQPTKKDDPAPGGTTDTPPEAEVKMPAGASAGDIRAVRGAQAMLQAEAKLKKLVAEGKITGVDKILPFEEISSWPYQDGLKGMPKSVQELDGKNVLMTGFMLPIDEVENIKQFLLVQSLWSCCYGQPPDINGIVRVVMKGKKRLDYEFEPIKIIGKFKVKATIEDGYCVDIFQLETESVEVIK
jgi:hypothetical protein